MLTTEADLQEKGETYLEAVVVSQRQKGLRASGYSAANTRFEVRRQGSTLVLVILGPSYWRQQQYGRRGSSSRKRPSSRFVQTIREWISAKGLPIPFSAAGAIAYKIVNEGITVPNQYNPGGVLSEPLEPTRIATDLKGSLSSVLKQRIVSRLLAA